jgi:exonuclease III
LEFSWGLDVMARLNIAFWNQNNLMEPGHGRGPRTTEDLQSHIARVVAHARCMVEDAMPHILALSEVGSVAIAHQLAQGLGVNNEYWLYAEPGSVNQTGIQLLVNPEVVRSLELIREYRPSLRARPRWVMAKVEVFGEPLVIVACHWPSDKEAGGDSSRRQAASKLMDALEDLNEDWPVVIGGDFNCEPYDPALTDPTIMRSSRFFGEVLRNRARVLYNPYWRLLHEPRTVAEFAGRRGHDGRIKRTWENKVFDQVLVSRELLQGVPFQLIESRLGADIHPGLLARNVKGEFVQAEDNPSDHLPAIASFSIGESHG